MGDLRLREKKEKWENDGGRRIFYSDGDPTRRKEGIEGRKARGKRKEGLMTEWAHVNGK